jgi:competence protein ComEC
LLAVWPLITYYFGLFSLVGLPATLLVLPALPAVMVTTALTGVLGLLYLPLAYVTGWLDWLWVSYLMVMVNLFAAIPWAALDIKLSGNILLWGYYGALAVAGVVWRGWFRRRRAEQAREAVRE